MTTTAQGIPVLPESTLHTLQHEAVEILKGGAGELVLDFSAVERIDAATALAMEELASQADRLSTKISLRGVAVGIYRALKLLKLAHRFTFLA